MPRATSVIQRRVATGAKPGTPVVVTNPAYKTKYRAVGKVVRASRQADHLVVAFDSVATPPSADGFRFHVDDLDHAPVHGKISVIPSGRQTFVLVGTTHGGEDLSGKVDEALLSGSSLVVEYPGLSGTGSATFGDDVHKAIGDKTQNTLARGAAARSDVTVIGADSRKAIVAGKIHSLSLRYKNEDIGEFVIVSEPSGDAMALLFKAFAGAARAGIAPGAMLHGLARFVKYQDGTDAGQVLTAACSRLRELWARMPPSDVDAIIGHAGKALLADLRKASSYFEGQKIEYLRHKAPLDTLMQERNTDLITALYDAISNLTLLTETLAAPSSKVIVAFGAEHMGPLKALLTDQRR